MDHKKGPKEGGGDEGDADQRRPLPDERRQLDELQDEHGVPFSTSDHSPSLDDTTASAGTATTDAQQVLNCVLEDEKAVEQEFRAAARRIPPRKIKTDPIRPAPRNTTTAGRAFSQSVVNDRGVQFLLPERQRRRGEHGNHTEEGNDINDVNLLQLAAERSRGIYRDTDEDTDDNDHKEEGDLLRGSENDPSLEKIRHMDAKAPYSKFSSAAAGSTTSSNTSITTRSDNFIPGAYQASPGMRIQRTPEFTSESLGHTATDYDPDITRSSSAARPDLEAIVDNSADLARISEPPIINAVRVDQDDLERNLRDEITNNAAQAEVVDLEQETNQLMETKLQKVHRRYYAYGSLCFLIASATIVGMIVGFLHFKKKTKRDNTNNGIVALPPPMVTLATIRARGNLNCGLTKRDETAEYLTNGVEFHMEICRAYAAAALGGAKNATFIIVSEEERWQALDNGTLDVLLVGTPAQSESLHWNLDPHIPVQFSTPFLFDGVGAGGMPDFIDNCVEGAGYENFANCRDLKVCVAQGSKASEVAANRLHPSQVEEVSQLEELYLRFAEGCCNVISTDYSNDRAEVVVREMGNYSGPYSIGVGLYTRQPYAAATRKHTWIYGNHSTAASLVDPHSWSEFVNWVTQALVAAEEANITQATAYRFQQTQVFGEEYRDMFRHAIKAVGNYGELYNRTRGITIPRAGINTINNGTIGLHYSWSIGNLADFGPPPYENGTLSNIRERGKLRCGMAMPQHLNSTGHEVLELGPLDLLKMKENFWTQSPIPMGSANLDFTYCRALSSAIFQGRLTVDDLTCSDSIHDYGKTAFGGPPRPNFDLIILKDEADGYSQLENGQIDVIAGYRMDLQSDVWRKTIGDGFSFTQPYFYGPTDGHVTDSNRCMVTQQHDQQWTDFVLLVVSSLFYAEENRYTQAMANDMPVVNRFGPQFKRMMRDAVFAVGNYGEVYQRAVENDYPRAGTTNELNTASNPQFASMPGLLS